MCRPVPSPCAKAAFYILKLVEGDTDPEQMTLSPEARELLSTPSSGLSQDLVEPAAPDQTPMGSALAYVL